MVHAVNDAGLLMDCSHTGRRCSLEIMQASAKPVIFSHANPLALVEHGRNISDEQIRACAATGGRRQVAMIVPASTVAMPIHWSVESGAPRRSPSGVAKPCRMFLAVRISGSTPVVSSWPVYAPSDSFE